MVLPGAANGGPGGVDGTDGGAGAGPVNDSDPTLAGSLDGLSPDQSMLSPISIAIVTAGGLAMLMAFLVFGRRRRRDEEDDGALAASAAAGYPLVAARQRAPTGGIAPVMAATATPIPAAQAASSPRVPEPDAHLPRWRRPSLMEARKNDPLRDGVTSTASLTFDERASEVLDGRERRRIRYRMVSLLNLPDEVQGVEIGSLDEGDEVVLMEKAGTYWRVLCPDGREGWLHKMTLGDVVIDSSSAATWTAADDGPDPGGFEDIMRAYNESRRQFGEA